MKKQMEFRNRFVQQNRNTRSTMHRKKLTKRRIIVALEKLLFLIVCAAFLLTMINLFVTAIIKVFAGSGDGLGEKDLSYKFQTWTDEEGSTQQLSTYTTTPGIAGKMIVVDAGHGGNDPGTSYGSILEKEYTLQMAKRLQKELERRGATVVMTRSDDSYVELERRAEIANQMRADLFVSVHIDYYEDSEEICGLTCHYMPDSTDGRRLAVAMEGEVRAAGIIRVNDSRESDFSVLRNTQMPAVLVETGYLSNSFDRQKLQDPEYHGNLATAIVNGIDAFFQ